jgi:alpha-L-fucosidase
MRTLILLLLIAHTATAQRPTEAQLKWHETAFYIFLHFGPNTYTDLEWGHGNETEDMFNPTHLDCDQWCQIAKSAGAKGIVITAKHHDGFCLWPSRFSQHTVRESRWRDGQGDVLRELSDACRRNGLQLGFYLSPWDRNHPQYGTPQYNDVYVATMTELMTQYGDLFEFWWDGANGEGPNGRKQVYDFHRFEREAARLQPQAIVFSDIGPHCRWAGNERGTVGDPNWGMLDTAGFRRGLGSPEMDTLQHGNIFGKHWIPAECDVSIRPGWFYHAKEDAQVKTPDQLWSIWMQSIGRGANLILNVPPMPNGRIHPTDSANLAAFGRMVSGKIDQNIVEKAGIEGKEKQTKSQKKLIDGRTNTAVELKKALEQAIVVDLKNSHPRLVILQEHIAEGQFISHFALDAWNARTNEWEAIHQGNTIGYRRWVELPTGLQTERLRVRVTGLRQGEMASICEVKVY